MSEHRILTFPLEKIILLTLKLQNQEQYNRFVQNGHRVEVRFETFWGSATFSGFETFRGFATFRGFETFRSFETFRGSATFWGFKTFRGFETFRGYETFRVLNILGFCDI